MLIAALLLGQSLLTGTPAAIMIHDEKSLPESVTVAGDGSVITGSSASPYVYVVKGKSAKAERFIDASAEGPGTFFLGQLADAATDTLWTCQLKPIPDKTPGAHRSSLRGFSLKTGNEKMRWDLPGSNSICNDLAIGPDKGLYITDTANAKIYRLPVGAQSAELFIEHRALTGVDGIAFLNGSLYVNNVYFNKLYRIPVDDAGKPGTPVDIWMDAPVSLPDGLRAANGKLFMAAAGSGSICALTIAGDIAHVTVLKSGLKTPTGVAPSGDTLWYTERDAGRISSIAISR